MASFINANMSRYRSSRMWNERKVLLEKRLPVLNEVAKGCANRHPPNMPTPTAAELLNIQLVRDLIDNTSLESFTAAHFNTLRQRYADVVLEWKARTEAKLIGLIEVAWGSTYTFDPTTVLQLATTVFSCTRCKDNKYKTGENLWHPNVLVHYHSYPWIDNRFDTDLSALERRLLQEHTGNTFWNYDGYIFFKKENMQIMSEVLNRFGFDPAVTTSAEMDATNPMFECVSCNCPRKGRCVLRWNMLVSLNNYFCLY